MKRIALLLGTALIAGAPIAMIERVSTVQAATAVSGEEFVTTAGVAGMFEIESSKIAAQKSQSADVKSFAERMISDHTKAAEELKSTAKTAGDKYVVPTALDSKHQAMMDELKNAEQDKFDATYVRMQTDAHKEAVALFDGYAKQGDNIALRGFAEKTLPTLQQHYQMIQQIGASRNQAQATQAAPQPTTDQKQAQMTTQPAAGSSSLTVSGVQAGNVVMASSLIGSTLYSANNENVGDVNDIAIGKDGMAHGVVVGVGGFLGLGEKDVLVPMDRIQVGHDDNNNVKFTITATRQDLEQAPAFDRTRWSTSSSPTTTNQ